MKTLWTGKSCFAGHEISLPGRANEYTITDNEIYWSSGLLGKEEDSLKLYNVEDVKMFRGFIDRLFGQGTVTIYSCDRSTPQLQLFKIKDPKEVLRLVNDLMDKSAINNRIRRGRYQDYDDNNDFPDNQAHYGGDREDDDYI